MFDRLSDRLTDIFKRLRGRGLLSEEDVNAALREIRIALLEADVALPVVKEFINTIKEKAIGQEVLSSVTPGQQVVKIVHDHLVQLLSQHQASLNLAAVPPVIMMIVGLQGSGKTTSTAKLGRYLQQKQRKKVLMASLDIYRPAAQEQLEILGKQIQLSTLPIVPGQLPLEIAQRAVEVGRLEGYDVVLLDTAGRLHIDDDLMRELTAVRDRCKPTETLLVADAMIGQDAVNVAETFHHKIGLTGIVLTRVDGDARGGAALSMAAITGCPIKMLGVGERVEQLEEFHPERIVSRILDMGDIVALVERAAEVVDQQEAEALAKKMEAGIFDLNDMASQLEKMQKMGGLKGLLKLMPGAQALESQLQRMGPQESVLKRQLAIIHSMTLKERKNHKILNASRRRRIAAGSGTTVQEVNRLIKQFLQMGQMMKHMKKAGKGRFLEKLGGLFPSL